MNVLILNKRYYDEAFVSFNTYIYKVRKKNNHF